MIKTRFGNWTPLAAVLLCFAACGKKEAGTPTPALSPPHAVEKVPAQAEVKASSGPVELTLLLHNTQLKAGDYLWQQVRMRNVGDKEIVVAGDVFHDPWALRDQSRSEYFVYLEARGPDGKPLKVNYQAYREEKPDHIADVVSGLLEVEGREEKAMLDGWRKQGLSDREIGYKLIEFNTNKKRKVESDQHNPGIRLLPGQSVETKSAFFYSGLDRIHKRPVPHPIGDFAQVDFFFFDKPGKYKVRAAYDGLPGKLAREAGLPSYPGDVLVRTPWVSVEVLP